MLPFGLAQASADDAVGGAGYDCTASVTRRGTASFPVPSALYSLIVIADDCKLLVFTGRRPHRSPQQMGYPSLASTNQPAIRRGSPPPADCPCAVYQPLRLMVRMMAC